MSVLLTTHIDKLLRTRVQNSNFWKEKCFHMTIETLLEFAANIHFLGSIDPVSGEPTEFLCLLVKLLQLKPGKKIIYYILNCEELKYVRALAMIYVRLTLPAQDVYTLLEPIYSSHHKLLYLTNNGKIEMIYMDQLVEILLYENEIFGITIGTLTEREILEKKGLIQTYKSPIEDEIKNKELNI